MSIAFDNYYFTEEHNNYEYYGLIQHHSSSWCFEIVNELYLYTINIENVWSFLFRFSVTGQFRHIYSPVINHVITASASLSFTLFWETHSTDGSSTAIYGLVWVSSHNIYHSWLLSVFNNSNPPSGQHIAWYITLTAGEKRFKIFILLLAKVSLYFRI